MRLRNPIAFLWPGRSDGNRIEARDGVVKLRARGDPIRLVMIDDHRVVLAGLRALFERQDDFEIVGEATNARDAIAICSVKVWHVALVDLQLGTVSGVDLIRALNEHDAHGRTIAFSGSFCEEDVRQVVDAGADGFLSKYASAEEILAAVRQVDAGLRYFSSDAAFTLSNH